MGAFMTDRWQDKGQAEGTSRGVYYRPTVLWLICVNRQGIVRVLFKNSN